MDERGWSGTNGSNFVTFYWNLYTGGIYLLNGIHGFFFRTRRLGLFSLSSLSVDRVCQLRKQRKKTRASVKEKRRQCFSFFLPYLHSETFKIFIRRLKSRHLFFWQIAIYGFHIAVHVHTHNTQHTDALSGECLVSACPNHLRSISEIGFRIPCHFCLLHLTYFFAYWSKHTALHIAHSLSKMFSLESAISPSLRLCLLYVKNNLAWIQRFYFFGIIKSGRYTYKAEQKKIEENGMSACVSLCCVYFSKFKWKSTVFRGVSAEFEVV